MVVEDEEDDGAKEEDEEGVGAEEGEGEGGEVILSLNRFMSEEDVKKIRVEELKGKCAEFNSRFGFIWT